MKKHKHSNRHGRPAAHRSKENPLLGRTFQGELEVNRGGNGYVTIKGLPQDVKIYKENLSNAIEGDLVKIEIVRVSKNGKMVGVVNDVLEHRQIEFVGKLEVSEGFGFLIPDQENIPWDIFIPAEQLNHAKDGETALVHILEWPGKTKNPIGQVVDILTGHKENDIAMREIITSHGFSIGFSETIMKEVEKLPEKIDAKEIAGRKDMRDIPTFTIDPKDAKDFDDALSVRRLDNGNIEVGIHIADVTYYVRPGTELDKEAYRRSTSVYLPDRVTPMLPEKISNFLCSLRPQEDKLAFSVIFQLNDQATVQHYWTGRTIIRSDRRFAYEDAQRIIKGEDGDFKDEILWLNRLAQRLRKKRFAKGAINFSSEEVQFELNEEGVPIGLKVKKSEEANQLIEEFMLLANKTIAAKIDAQKVNNKPIPFPYRVHDRPDEAKLAVYAAFVSRFGYHLDLEANKIAKSFNELLEKAEGRPEKSVLEQLGIRTMAKAVYSTDNIGHYGLQFKDYCHFTSPIRRYPDIMVHRIVQEVLTNNIKVDKTMEEKCVHCSNQERKAVEAEREGDKYKQVEYLSQHLGEDLDAIITGVSSMGLWAETIEYKCEGMIRIEELLDWDTFSYLEDSYCLQGDRTGLRLQMGDMIRIKVLSTNLEKRQINFALVEAGNRKSNLAKNAGNKKKRKK